MNKTQLSLSAALIAGLAGLVAASGSFAADAAPAAQPTDSTNVTDASGTKSVTPSASPTAVRKPHKHILNKNSCGKNGCSPGMKMDKTDSSKTPAPKSDDTTK